MQIYSFNEYTHELLINTLREVDYIDACTPAIPMSAVVADQSLPDLDEHQTLIVYSERNSDGHLTVSENVKVIEDYRQLTVYDIATGEKRNITQLGPLPHDITTQVRPDKYHIFTDGQWIMTEESTAQKEADAEQSRQLKIKQLIDAAAEQISAYQDLIDFSDTEEETVSGQKGYKIWRQYRAALLKYQKGLINEMPQKPE